MSSISSSTTSDAISEKNITLASKTYAEIKKLIIELHFPPGSVLEERILSEMLGVSRTPIRDALRRLAIEGWIVWPERKQAFVRSITPKDAAEIFVVRDMIETQAINIIFDLKEPRCLAGQLVPLAITMRDPCPDHVTFIKADMEFHSKIISFTENSRLSDLWKRISGEIMRIGIYSLYGDRKTELIYKEHETIIEGFWREDKNATIENIRLHHAKICEAYTIKCRDDNCCPITPHVSEELV